MKGPSIQRTLHVALQYFLYGSVSSSWLLEWLVRKRFLSAAPLTKLAATFQTLRLSQGRCGPLSFGGIITKRAFAETLAQAYQIWEETLPQWDVAQTRIRLGQSYREWCERSEYKSRYHPVHALSNVLECHDNVFLRAIVHGSVATLDDTVGSSDLDLAFVVRSEVLKDPDKLLHLREVAAEILALTYAFDPFMHHGPYYISEIDLGWYAEAMFPSVLFGYGVDLLDDSEELEIRTRPSEDITDQMLDMFERFFENWASNPFTLKDSYDLEWVLGNAMILPALYLQRKTGEFRYKRDTFPLAQQDFSAEEWEPIRAATELRANLGPRPKPSRLLVWVARRLRWPGLLQRWGRRHPQSVRRAQEAAEVLGPDYPDRVLRLLQSMRSKLPQPVSKAVETHNQEPTEVAISVAKYFDDIPHGPFTEMPSEVSEQQYDSATELLVSHWRSLSQRPLAIYQIGSVGAPGISDLDFVVVFPDGVSIDWAQYQPRAFLDWVQLLMTHPPYCCAESSWNQLPAWYPTFQLRHLWGETLPIPEIPNELEAGCALGMLADYLIVKVPRDFIWIAWERPLRVRTILAMLYSLKHTTKLAEQAGIAIPDDAQQTIPRVESLRTSWFGLDSSERLEVLAQLCGETCEVAGKLIHEVDEELSRSIDGPEQKSHQESATQENASVFNFTTPWTFEKAMQTAFEHYSRSGQIAWANPRSLSQVLAVYADESPQFQRYLHAQGCYPRLQWDGGVWNGGLRYHARAMVNYRESAAKLGVPAQKYVALGFTPQPPHWKVAAHHTKRLLRGEIRPQSVLRKLYKEVRALRNPL